MQLLSGRVLIDWIRLELRKVVCIAVRYNIGFVIFFTFLYLCNVVCINECFCASENKVSVHRIVSDTR
jgi:hypothetical protein